MGPVGACRGLSEHNSAVIPKHIVLPEWHPNLHHGSLKRKKFHFDLYYNVNRVYLIKFISYIKVHV